MILAGDVGGTKTILALFKQELGSWVCSKKDVFVSADFATFEQLLNSFLSTEKKVTIQHVCIGVAGPIVDGDCSTTNLPWMLKRKEIRAQTGADKVVLLNDLEATAWGVLDLPDDNFIELNKKAKHGGGNIAVLAAGTGLGEALLVWGNGKYQVVATEGGHADFAPRNALEIGLLQYLMVIHPEHVSCERVVCGQGLVNIYHYLKSIKFARVDNNTEKQMEQSDAAAVISKTAMLGEDELCMKALQMFCELYGAEASNLALKCLPSAGIVLAGGIAAKILSIMQDGSFMKGYLAKGRYATVLEKYSVKVCLNSEVGLVGAKDYAVRMGGL